MGFAYAYQIPGMNKVHQAAGRVIRGENDRGLVLLIDDRFTSFSYRRLFPAHWNGFQVVRTPEAVSRRMTDFWDGSVPAVRSS